MTWTPIVGKSFKADEFHDYVMQLPVSTWKPQFVVVHNTGVPRLKEWHHVSGEERMKNLAHYYRDIQHWHGGPHLFVADDLIWVFTPLLASGVHSPSWNRISWGVETVGNFDFEEFKDPQKALLVQALATLHVRGGFAPTTMRFHKEDPKTTHKLCPGVHMHKDELISLIEDALSSKQEHDPSIDRDLS